MKSKLWEKELLIKIAVVSDMHCMHSSSEKPPGNVSTYLHSDDIGRSETRHPIKALKKLIKNESLEAVETNMDVSFTHCSYVNPKMVPLITN